MSPEYSYSEDCLYLNVMTPHDVMSSKCPVIVYIHGGGFVSGGTNPFGYADICKNFVVKGFVFVTLAYRIGFLGFFTDGTEYMPGNYGLWDQREALVFIRDNIEKFGGDSQNVTVMGTSAGAASISGLSLSPHCKGKKHRFLIFRSKLKIRRLGLFKRGICLSGSLFCEWAISDNVVSNCKKILQHLDCPIQYAKDELKKKGINELMNAVTETVIALIILLKQVFVVVLEA
uniref:Carboxylic ester hydrolase n=1 Tax=Syphacia muris TaxID=451379 RepID=A0A0N5ABL1_9BILA